jgi:hypothetical protein
VPVATVVSVFEFVVVGAPDAGVPLSVPPAAEKRLFTLPTELVSMGELRL